MIDRAGETERAQASKDAVNEKLCSEIHLSFYLNLRQTFNVQ